MKTYSLKNQSRTLTAGLISMSLGLIGCTGLLATTTGQPDNNSAAKMSSDSQTWEQQFDDRIQHIQREMDDLFHESMSSMSMADTDLAGWPKFDASATVQDHGNSYVATFDLPKRDLSNVKVAVKDGVLSVNASAEQTIKPDSKDANSKAPEEENVMLNQYEQLVTLPGPVDSAKMKVDKQGDSIVVTIPKKDEKAAAER
jgi:HSP20 family molecular chaperone IbpA